jgi:hypothetical protein
MNEMKNDSMIILCVLEEILMKKYKVELLTVEFAVDLGSGLRWRKPTVPCL